MANLFLIMGTASHWFIVIRCHCFDNEHCYLPWFNLVSFWWFIHGQSSNTCSFFDNQTQSFMHYLISSSFMDMPMYIYSKKERYINVSCSHNIISFFCHISSFAYVDIVPNPRLYVLLWMVFIKTTEHVLFFVVIHSFSLLSDLIVVVVIVTFGTCNEVEPNDILIKTRWVTCYPHISFF